jgi:hypothetical protein
MKGMLNQTARMLPSGQARRMTSICRPEPVVRDVASTTSPTSEACSPTTSALTE